MDGLTVSSTGGRDMMKSIVALCAIGFLTMPVRAQTPIVDQVGPSVSDAGASINECCAFVFQTFTAGLNGSLVGVSVSVPFANSSLPLNVAIRAVENGYPTSTVLASATLQSPNTFLDQIVTFPAPVPIVASKQYAIALSYPGAPPGSGGTAEAATGDLYSGGKMLIFYDPGWLDGGVDLLFKTYVVPAIDSGTQAVLEQIPGSPFTFQGYGSGSFQTPALSPDGTRLYFSSPGTSQILTLALAPD